MFIKHTLNSSNYMCYIEFHKVSDNKYKFINHSADSFNGINSICINTNFGDNNQQTYNVIYGLIHDKQENRYIITSDNNSFEYTFERNVFFAKEFKMKNPQTFS